MSMSLASVPGTTNSREKALKHGWGEERREAEWGAKPAPSAHLFVHWEGTVTEVTQQGKEGLDGGWSSCLGVCGCLLDQVATGLSVFPSSSAKGVQPHFLQVAAGLPQVVMSGLGHRQ